MTTEDKKIIWLTWLFSSKKYCPPSLTKNRLNKHYQILLNNKQIWGDLFFRHNLTDFPWRINQESDNFKHGVGNLVGNIVSIIGYLERNRK
jgi:hypothetical protein